MKQNPDLAGQGRQDMTMESISFQMTNKQKCFGIFQPQVEEFGEKHGWSMKVTFGITLILDELITNIISYGYTDFDEHPIDVTVSTDREIVAIRIEDDARPFNILEAPEPELDVPLEERERPIGGMGVHLVKKMTNCVNYKREDGRNILEINKRISEDCTCCEG